jgi:hypothetical protein
MGVDRGTLNRYALLQRCYRCMPDIGFVGLPEGDVSCIDYRQLLIECLSQLHSLFKQLLVLSSREAMAS